MSSTTTKGLKEHVYDIIANVPDDHDSSFKRNTMCGVLVAVMFAVPGISIQCTSINKRASLRLGQEIVDIIKIRNSECIIKFNEEELVIIPPDRLPAWSATEKRKRTLESASRIQFSVSS